MQYGGRLPSAASSTLNPRQAPRVDKAAIESLLAFCTPCLPLSFNVRDTTNKHHITNAVLIFLYGFYKSIAAQSQALTRRYNQRPDEVVGGICQQQLPLTSRR
jgi:hypothetical protein